MSEFAVAPLILLPTHLDACVIGGDLFLPAGKMSRQGNLLLVACRARLLDQQGIAIPTGFEAVELPAQAGLPAIDATSV
jgi:hypothetical protein